jgi:hypothetical protein
MNRKPILDLADLTTAVRGVSRRAQTSRRQARAVLVAVVLTALGLSIAPTHAQPSASDAKVLECRATQDAKISAGMCGAHGCDCGNVQHQKNYLDSFDAKGRQGMNYVREAYGYTHDCRRAKAKK